MKRVTLEQLPEWFDLSRYEGTAALNLIDWRDNFYLRVILFNLKDEELPKYQHIFEKFVTGDHSMVYISKSSEWDKDRLEQNIKDFKVVNSDQSGLRQASVRSLPASYSAALIAMARHPDSELYDDNLSELMDRLLSASEYVYEDMVKGGEIDRENVDHEFLETPIDLLERRADQYVTVPRLHLEINMFAPDAMIIDDFKKWLKAARSEFDMPARNMFTPANMKSWSENQVLPYIDLTIWARYEGVIIRQETMGEAIFPNAIEENPDNPKDPASRIRKTVCERVNYLMRPSVLDAISAQCMSQGYFADD